MDGLSIADAGAGGGGDPAQKNSDSQYSHSDRPDQGVASPSSSRLQADENNRDENTDDEDSQPSNYSDAADDIECSELIGPLPTEDVNTGINTDNLGKKTNTQDEILSSKLDNPETEGTTSDGTSALKPANFTCSLPCTPPAKTQSPVSMGESMLRPRTTNNPSTLPHSPAHAHEGQQGSIPEPMASDHQMVHSTPGGVRSLAEKWEERAAPDRLSFSPRGSSLIVSTRLLRLPPKEPEPRPTPNQANLTPTQTTTTIINSDSLPSKKPPSAAPQPRSPAILSINNSSSTIKSSRLAPSTLPTTSLTASLYSSPARIPPHAWMTLTPSTLSAAVIITTTPPSSLSRTSTPTHPGTKHPWSPPNQPTRPINRHLTT
ncbi:hypothetical protein PtA15_2A568 [Puccinia triticina]|uniref:Uncharacterized protein n=1 Tax=Puccinia triticina TaxID=208348 RepID=A0ABY7CAP3_9BASI|nr:uncharacterized protein PtA15_2A568 [Puccinia triticina]WAQ82251.1 hypothetical protein PtA15_2A568 [Puccinia triticina]WAR53104.1 hypothetical protein PtB15_2B535 [Puccinia triticina]